MKVVIGGSTFVFSTVIYFAGQNILIQLKLKHRFLTFMFSLKTFTLFAERRLLT